MVRLHKWHHARFKLTEKTLLFNFGANIVRLAKLAWCQLCRRTMTLEVSRVRPAETRFSVTYNHP